MTIVFADESGELGFKEAYFVIAIIVPQNKKRLINFMKRFCADYSLSEVKASRLDFKYKQLLIQKLLKVDDYRISYIVVDKTKIINPQFFKDKNLLYNYLFQLLIKPILKEATEDIEILLDNHSTKVKSTNSLCDYIKIKAFAEWDVQVNVDIRYVDSKESKIVQIADLIANVVYGHYVYKKDHLYNMLTFERSLTFPE